MSPLWTIAPIGLFAGAAAIWLFRRLTGRAALRAAVNRIQAHLLEFWLFADEPATVWKSWRGLLAANARLLRLLLVPLAAISVPMVPLFFWLDTTYGRAPLPAGRPIVVTAGFRAPLDAPPALTPPAGIAIDGPPVRVPTRREVSWRLIPHRPVSANLRFVFSEQPQWVEVTYPPALSSFPWLAWFVAFSLLGACLANRGLAPIRAVRELVASPRFARSARSARRRAPTVLP